MFGDEPIHDVSLEELDAEDALELLGRARRPTAVHLVPDGAPLDPPARRRVGVDLGVADRGHLQQSGEVAARPAVVDGDEHTAGPEDTFDLGEPGLRTGAEEVRESGMGDVDRAIVDGEVLGRAVADVDPSVTRHSLLRDGEQVLVGLDADDRRGPFGVARQPEAGAAPDVQHTASVPQCELVEGGVEATIAGDRLVLQLVGRRVAGDVRCTHPVRKVHHSSFRGRRAPSARRPAPWPGSHRSPR